jgi:penicillin-binding protein 1A
MKPSGGVEVGDFLEGIVTEISPDKTTAIVEFYPGRFATLKFEDMKWAFKRVSVDEDDEFVAKAPNHVGDVLRLGDVIKISVTKVTAASTDPIEAQLEQDTEVEGALLAVDPRNGLVRSMVGGYDFERSQFNRAIQARRQPGSVFKPVVYAAALDLGFTPATLIQDTPITFENAADREKWRPSNYDNRFLGEVTLRNSLLASRNIPTIRLLNDVGVDAVIQYARRLGIKSPLERDFTLALGSSVTPLIEMIQPYIVFSTGGYQQEPLFIRKIVDRDGQILEEHLPFDENLGGAEAVLAGVSSLKAQLAPYVFNETPPEESETVSFLQDVSSQKKNLKRISSPLKPGQALSSEVSFLMTHLLKENILYGTGRRARELNRPASGKTGTTDQNRDAWFIGYTPDLVTGVWIGYDDLRILGRFETGSRAAVPVWLDYMAKVTGPYPVLEFSVPDTIEFARIDPRTGGLADENERGSALEAFIQGTAPTEKKQKVLRQQDLYLRDR